MTTKSEICNLALSRLGDKRTVNDIDNPIEDIEKTFSKWYDVSRRSALRRMMPSFAHTRKLWALSNFIPDFGYRFAYKVRSDCVKVLGIGDLCRSENNYSVEGGYILTNEEYENGLPVRYVSDVQEIDRYTDNFIELFSLMLAYNVAPEITESASRLQYIDNALANKIAETMGVDSQENKPIIIKKGRLQAARRGLPYGVVKN